MAEPRPSTDEESAPLLRNHDEAEQPDGSHGSGPWAVVASRTRLEKLLMALALLLLILASTFIGLFAGAEHNMNKERSKHHHGDVTTTVTATHTHSASRTHSGSHGYPTGKPNEDVCVTPECVLLSASILASLNTNVDPCDDFYEYSTGGWAAAHTLPPSKGIYTAFQEVADHNKKIVADVLASIPSKMPSNPSAEDENLQKLKAFYDSCMDTDELNKLGLKPMLPLVDRLVDLFGPFDVKPALEDELDADYEPINGDYVVPDALRIMSESRSLMRHGASQSAVQRTPLPALDEVDWVEEEQTVDKLTSALSFLHSRGVEALLTFNIEGDAGGDDPQLMSLWLYQTGGGLPSKEYYEEEKLVSLYTDVIGNILFEIANATDAAASASASGWPWPFPGGLPGVDKEQERRKRMQVLARKVVEFERELIRAGLDPEHILDPSYTYNPHPTKDVAKHLPFLDLAWYISTFAPRSFPKEITVTHPAYLRAASRLVARTPEHVLSGYFATRLAMTYAEQLGADVPLRKEYQRLQDVLAGTKPGVEENREDVCLAAIDPVVGLIAGAGFVKKAFPPEAKKQTEDIIVSIIDAFKRKLAHIPWMDEYSYKAAQAKAAAIVPKIGYPLSPNTTDDQALKMYYGRLKIDKDDLFGNVARSAQIAVSREWMTLDHLRDNQTWMDMMPQTVNAYMSPTDNEIVFPAGILQPPFFDSAAPSFMNYGAFGAVAAHELTHAFDNTGAQYDEHGRLRNWWSNVTTVAFQQRAQCIAQQYSEYYVLDEEGRKVHVNGNLTNGEDIADSGVAQAYAAWIEHRNSTSGKAVKLPGLNFTDEQLFFISYGRIWAQLEKPATSVSRVRTDPHSPRPWRVKGTLSNSKEFHDAFNCKIGDKMRPRHQCELW